MDSTSSNPRFWTRTKIIIAAALCLLLAFGAFLFSQQVNPAAFHNRPNVENLNKLSPEEMEEAQEELESAFLLVPESSVIVSHVNLNALAPDVQQRWWDEWFFKMLPPEMTNLRSLDGMEGLNSITVASYRPVQEYDPENPQSWIDNPLLYTVIFNVDSEFANQSRELIAERNANPDSLITFPASMSGFLDENGVPMDNTERTQSIAVTQTLGMPFIDALNNGNGESLDPNTKWFGVDTEPILYLNVSQYLDSFSFTTDEAFGGANNEIQKAMLGMDSDKDFIWIGESLDFGNTWSKKKNVDENKTNSNDPSLISAEAWQEAIAGTAAPGLVDADGTLQVPDSENPNPDDLLVETGIADQGLIGLLEAVSVKLPGQPAVGIARDPHSVSPGTVAQPTSETGNGDSTAPTEDDIIVVISPINLLNVYKGAINASFVRTLTFTFRPDDSSTLTFDFKTEEEMIAEGEEVEGGIIETEEGEVVLPPITEDTEETVVTSDGSSAPPTEGVEE